MSTSQLHRWVNETPERAREYAREALIVDVSEEIWAALEKANVSHVDLAQRLGTSKSHVSQLLNGSRNMTLRSLADIAHAIGLRPCVKLLQKDETWEEAQGVVTREPVHTMATIVIRHHTASCQLHLPNFVGPVTCNEDIWWDVESASEYEIEAEEAAPRHAMAAG